jgi:disulfide bond formation protein DsbB
MAEPTLPLSHKNLVRILVALIIGLSLLAGFYHAAYQTELRRSAKLIEECEALTARCTATQTSPDTTQ